MQNVFKYLSAALLLIGIGFFLPENHVRAKGDSMPVVVELFTSQGCSSCPPADSFLNDLSRRDDVIALSLHVDYWDYIGWEDPFATPESTNRQRRYAPVLAERSVYTPQMVIDGAAHEVGSKRKAVTRLINSAAMAKRLRVSVDAGLDGAGNFIISVPAAKYDGDAAIWLMSFDKGYETPVERGENAGETLHNVNVVREIMHVGDWRGAATKIVIPADALNGAGRAGYVVLLQPKPLGPIIGAARIMLGG